MTIGWAWQNWNESAGGGFVFASEVMSNALACPSASAFRNVLVRLDDSPAPRDHAFAEEIVADKRRGESLFLRLKRRLNGSCNHNLEQNNVSFRGKALAELVDILVFPYPGFLENADLPQLAVVWDLAHRYLPIFPELSHQGTRKHREKYFENMFRTIDRVIVGTRRGVDEVADYYGFERNNIAVIPHPTPLLTNHQSKVGAATPPAGSYALYPAQFWAHKNHVTLLKAWKILRAQKVDCPRLVFTGRDYGNENWLKEQASAFGLGDIVEFRGFVSRQELLELYEGAGLLVYPSLFGPENLPPLEAMSQGCPVLVSDYPGAKEQYGDAARYVSPVDERSWANEVINLLENPASREELVKAGRERAEKFTTKEFIAELWKEIDQMARYRGLWKQVG